MTMYTTTFQNATLVPINIETWQPAFFGLLSTVNMKTVKSGEKITMSSETGEWLLNSYFIEKDICDTWITSGNTNNLGKFIGKFWNEKNKHSFMLTDDFEIKYINGIATFLKKE